MFRRYNFSVSISTGFLLLVAWFGIMNGWDTLLLVLSGAAVHELGHCLALWKMGGTVARLKLSVFGAELETNSSCLSYGRELLCVLAGPASNAFCAAAAIIKGGKAAQLFAGANLVLCIFNLLPVRPLDGGRILELLLSCFFGQTAGEYGARAVGALFAVLLASVIFWIMWNRGGSFWLIPAAIAFCGTAWREIFGN